MKKTGLTIVASMLLLCSMAFSACAEEGQLPAEPTEVPASQTDMVVEAPSIHLPDSYAITFAVSNNDGTINFIKKTMDAENNLLIEEAKSTTLYLYDQGYYRLVGDLENKLYTPKHANNSAEKWNDCADKTWIWKHANPTLIGSTTIADRACEEYQVELNIGIYKRVATFAIDKETGLCLQYQVNSELFSFAIEDEVNFTCVEFIAPYTELVTSHT